jgi:hypothetical protein
MFVELKATILKKGNQIKFENDFGMMKDIKLVSGNS